MAHHELRFDLLHRVHRDTHNNQQRGAAKVELDAEAWDRLVTWIDLNVPDHGTWGEHRAIPEDFHQRRIDMFTRYANRPEDPEAIPEIPGTPVDFVQPKPPPKSKSKRVKCPDWPFDAKEATRRQEAAYLAVRGRTLGPVMRRTLDLGNGVTMDLTLLPAGEFVMGGADGPLDERPRHRVRLDAPFWAGVLEVTNAQFRQFDPEHDNGYFDQHHKDHTTPGYPAHDPDLPVMRVAWTQAMAFCDWLSDLTGETVTLPTEAQWEWACRAGTATPLYYGDPDTDFGPHANLADASLKLMAVTGVNPQPIDNPNPYQDFLPKDDRFDDRAKLTVPPGGYAPNPWGLHDMHGNVWEWTRSTFRAYPYADDDGRNDLGVRPRTAVLAKLETRGSSPLPKRVVRGGSWRDRPGRARSAFRLAYQPYQQVHNVGFRVIIPTRQRLADSAR